MQSFNIVEGLESETYTWKKSNPAAPSGAATTEVETRTYSGSLFYLQQTLAPALLASGTDTRQVTVQITRKGGGMAELTMTATYFDGQDQGGGDPDDPGSGSGSAPAGSVGTSAENPVYDIQITENRIPILLHPRVREQDYAPESAEGIALRMLCNGSDFNASFTTGSAEYPVPWTVGDALENVPWDIIELVSSQSEYLAPGLVLTVRWQIDGAAPAPDVGDFFRVATPEGPVSTPEGRNWLLAGGGATIEGDRVMMTKKYILSDPGGWDETLYGK